MHCPTRWEKNHNALNECQKNIVLISSIQFTHLNIFLLFIIDSAYTICNISWISGLFFLSFTKNLMLILCSVKTSRSISTVQRKLLSQLLTQKPACALVNDQTCTEHSLDFFLLYITLLYRNLYVATSAEKKFSTNFLSTPHTLCIYLVDLMFGKIGFWINWIISHWLIIDKSFRQICMLWAEFWP